MGHLSKLVLLASIVAGCISYSIDSTKNVFDPEPPEEPSESESSEFPTEFMNKLIASLTPEELEELKKPTTLGESSLEDRDGEYGDTEKAPCNSTQDVEFYNTVTAMDGEEYYVINSPTQKLQSVIHYACDIHGNNDNKCDPGNNDKNYGYCCRQNMAIKVMYVVPLPKSSLYRKNQNLFLKGTDTKYENYTMIPKDVSMTSDCSCHQSMASIKENYTCPNPASKSFI